MTYSHDVELVCRSWKGDHAVSFLEPDSILNVQAIFVDGEEVKYREFQIESTLLSLILLEPDDETWERFEDPLVHMYGSDEGELRLAIRKLLVVDRDAVPAA